MALIPKSQDWYEILSQLSSPFAPARCCGCLRVGTWLCVPCRQQLTQLPLRCVVCGKAHPQGRLCDTCRGDSPLRGVVSAGAYSTPLLQRGVQWLKYKGVRGVARTLAELLVAPLLTIAPLPQLAHEAVLVPIPLHRRRLRWRGFNQAVEISESLSQLTRIPSAHALTRARSTWTQAHLPTQLRTENLHAAFHCIAATQVCEKTVILVDDVTTSGATLLAAADSLRMLPVKQVWGATVAQG